jgi:hypothetical protein
MIKRIWTGMWDWASVLAMTAMIFALASVAFRAALR